MALTGDMSITTSTPTEYNYMIVERNGQKAWEYRPIFTNPPDMTKGMIRCTILAAPKMRQSTGGTVITTRTIGTVLTELAACNAQLPSSNLTIVGHDGGTYYVLMSQTPITYRATYDASGRQEQFEIDLEFIQQHT